MKLYDIDEETETLFNIGELVRYIHLFDELAGYSKIVYSIENPVDIEATENMAQIHDFLMQTGYTGKELEIFLVRLVFCLFADDTTLFEQNNFESFIVNSTREDGTDLGARLIELFCVLDTPKERRSPYLDETLSVFPYVDGNLFSDCLRIPCFNKEMRELLLDCCKLDWGLVSPAIFGSMFQNVINQDFRRLLGAHFTSEKNILKLIKPLFLDKLWEKFNSIKDSKPKLKAFHEEIAGLRFIDPACGCGNFLVVIYREMRMLEIEVLKALNKEETLVLNVKDMLLLDVDSYYGIEIEEFPAKVAELALWLTDHQMNIQAHKAFGQYFVRLPLEKKPNIFNDNALRLDWKKLSDKPFDFITGNPPFVGKQNEMQQEDQQLTFANEKRTKELDHVACWFYKAAEYMYENQKTKTAFVSTNSLSQGQQVGTLWGILLNRFGVKIDFAHQTFKW
jgi:type II restriction/modification system DNA methylase subunit YeeA